MSTDPHLARILEDISERTLPPVQDWQPSRTGVVDIRILSNGDWLYGGTPIHRHRMVQLFSTVLRADEDGETYLVTPHERLQIQVDEAPFTAVSMELHGTPEANALVFTTNVGDKVVADAAHPIEVEYDEPDGEPKPFILVRDRLRALISRSVFIELAEHVEEREGSLGVLSCDCFMPLYRA